MNRGLPLQNAKRKREGQEERILLLELYFQGVRKWLRAAMERIPWSKAALDDVLDALALGLSATEMPGPLSSIPVHPVEYDARGFPMRIWHPTP